MTEFELRKKLVNTAISYLGCNERDGSFKKIIDLYNSRKPLARGYAVKYTDEWCSTFASAMAIACQLTDIIPVECSCVQHIELFKKLNSWVEADNYVPNVGDYIFYYWKDGSNYATTDVTAGANHVGIVTACDGKTITVIEGNKGEAVAYRYVAVNGRYIRGFGTPKYAKVASTYKEANNSDNSDEVMPAVGDVVNFTGTKHYYSSSSATGKDCKPGKAKVTAVTTTGAHRVHLVAVAGGGSNVYGWVDSAFITPEIASLAVGSKVRVKSGAKTYTGGSLASFVYKNTYDVISINEDRVVIGIGRIITAAMNKKDLTVV